MKIKSITKLQDGMKGIVFKITTSEGERVVKFQDEHPARTMIGTEIMQEAGVCAPKVSAVSGNGMKDFQEAVKDFIKQMEEGTNSNEAAIGKRLLECLEGSVKRAEYNKLPKEEQAKAERPKISFPHVIQMDFASGMSIGKMLNESNSKKKNENEPERVRMKNLMTNPEFHKQLGAIMAANAFNGNGDQFAGRYDFMGLQDTHGLKERMAGATPVTGFLNEGNLIIEGEGTKLKLKPIDNDFTPGKNVKSDDKNSMVFGRAKGMDPIGSIAAANPEQFKREVFALAETMETNAGFKLSPEELKTFVENVVKSGKETMSKLLESEVLVKKIVHNLAKSGMPVDEAKKLAGEFGEHRKALLLLSGSEGTEIKLKPTVAQMMGIARKTGPVTNEKVLEGLGLTGEVAKEVAKKENLEEFNKLTGGADLERFKTLMQSEQRAAHTKDHKLTVKEAVLLAKDESTFRQFTGQKGPKL